MLYNKNKQGCTATLFVLFALLANKTIAQNNLVLNPSFELFANCPINNSLAATLYNKPNEWYKPDKRGAIYYNACSNGSPSGGVPFNYLGGGLSYQYAKTGDAYMVMGYLNSGHHDYMQIQLTDSCKKNKKYFGVYYVNLANTCKYGCNNIGMLFTKNVVYADTINKSLLLGNPQILNYGNPIVTDTLGWVKISGIFTAQGGEQYLTLGNFKTQANTLTKNIQPFGYDGSGYYVDDVAVYALDSFCLKADAGRDTTIAQGDSVFIGSYTNGIDSLAWFNVGGQKIDSTRPGFWVKPTANIFYVLQQTINGCFSSDTVWVNVLLPLKFTMYDVRFTMEKRVENIWATATEINVSHFNIQRSTNGKDFITVGKVAAKNGILNNYTFMDELKTNTQYPKTLYYRIQTVDKDGKLNYTSIKSLNINHSSLNVMVYPNPAKDEVNISCVGMKEIKLINQLGQVIYQQNTNNINHLSLNINHYSKGLYLLQVISNKGEVKNEKLIVE